MRVCRIDINLKVVLRHARNRIPLHERGSRQFCRIIVVRPHNQPGITDPFSLLECLGLRIPVLAHHPICELPHIHVIKHEIIVSETIFQIVHAMEFLRPPCDVSIIDRFIRERQPAYHQVVQDPEIDKGGSNYHCIDYRSACFEAYPRKL